MNAVMRYGEARDNEHSILVCRNHADSDPRNCRGIDISRKQGDMPSQIDVFNGDDGLSQESQVVQSNGRSAIVLPVGIFPISISILRHLLTSFLVALFLRALTVI